MPSNYEIHERMYQMIRAKGGPGLGVALNGWPERQSCWRGYSRRPRCQQRAICWSWAVARGNYARLLHERGYQVTGVDVSPTAVAWAREKATARGYPIRFFQADLSQPRALAGKQYDLVVDGNCLHCIIGADRPQFLANVWAALRPGGLFFISSLCSQSEHNRMTHREGQPYRQIMAPANLLAELKAAGFGIEQSVIHSGELSNHITIHARKLA